MKIRAAILLLILIASGCTSSFVYNRIDTVFAWHVEELVTLTRAQREDLRAWLGNTLEWHRTSELSKYAEFLRALSRATEQGATRATFEDAEQTFRGFTRDLAQRSAPEVARLLLNLSDVQVDELLGNLEERGLERLREEEELISRGKWHERRAKQIGKQVARWTGAVERNQKEIILSTAARLEPSYSAWLASQQDWREAVRTALANRHQDPQRAHSELAALLINPEQFWNSEYRSKLAHNRERTLDLFIELDRGLTAEQRAHLKNRFARIASELDTLARESPRSVKSRG